MLKGKKTYIVALGSILTAIGGVITGTLTVPEAIDIGVTAVLGATIRGGIQQAEKPREP